MNSIARNNNLETPFTIIDDLIALLKLKTTKPGRPNSLSLSDIAMISLLKSRYAIKNWKALYRLLQDKYSQDFTLPKYKNFVVTMNKYSWVLLVLINILLQINTAKSGVIKIVDSTPLPVCKNIRIPYHKVLKDFATRSKGTMGWFYGLKLHAVCDTKGNLIAIKFTTANYGDRKYLDEVLDFIKDSIIIADAGYISNKLAQKAFKRGNRLLTCGRKNSKKIATIDDIRVLNKRNRIEVMFSVLKERLNIVTSLPRSVLGYLAHYIHVIFGYLFNKLIS